MSTKSLEGRARRLSDMLQPRPLLIHCAGAKEEMLATLEHQIIAEGGDLSAPVEWSEDQEEWARQLSEMLGDQAREIERCYNVRFVD